GPRLRGAAAGAVLQLRHRAGARKHPQAGGDGTGGCMAGPRQAGDGRRSQRARAGRERLLTVGRRGRRQRLRAPASEYADAEGNVLTLRGSLSVGSRRSVAEAVSGGGPAASREDSWQRAFELLFERLAVSWMIADVPLRGQRELLGRLRMASP